MISLGGKRASISLETDSLTISTAATPIGVCRNRIPASASAIMAAILNWMVRAVLVFFTGAVCSLVFPASSTYLSRMEPMVSNKSMDFIRTPPSPDASGAYRGFDGAWMQLYFPRSQTALQCSEWGLSTSNGRQRYSVLFPEDLQGTG